MKRSLVLIGALALATILVATGCRRVDLVESGYLKTETRSVALEGATRAEIDLTMGAGDLSISGAELGGDVLAGEFEYAEDGKPEFDYDVSGTRGVLVIRQARMPRLHFGTTTNVWDVEVSRRIPLELRVTLGAGRSTLDLRDVHVSELDATMGAGEATVDLSGFRSEDVKGRIEAGAGSITVRVPADTGVRITGHDDGVGDFVADDFIVDGRALVNEAYGRSPVTIELQIVRGVGEIVLEIVDE